MAKLPPHISILVQNFHYTQSPRPNSSKNYSFFTQSPSPAQILQEWLNFHPVPRPDGSSSYNVEGQKNAPPIMPPQISILILNFQCTQSPKSEQKKSAVLDLTADAEGKNVWIQWHCRTMFAYSDTFSVSQHFHCKRGGLYWQGALDSYTSEN